MNDWRLVGYKAAAYLAVHLFLLTLFQPLTILFFWLSALVVRAYLKRVFRKLIEKGLIVYLPEWTQRTLKYRSLFDLMCDFWFIQSTSLAKVFFKPFFMHIQPDQAVEVLDELHTDMKEKVLTKGIINILPQTIRAILSPDQALTEEQAAIQLERLTDVQLMPMCRLSTDSLHAPNTRARETNLLQPTRKKETPVRRLNINNLDFQEGNISEPSSDQTVVRPKSKPKNTTQWDKLSFYRNFRNRANSKDNIFTTVKNNIAMLKNVLELKKVMVRVSNTRLAKLFVVFMVLLALQLKFYPRHRGRVLQALQTLLGVVTVLGGAGCIGMLVYKNAQGRHEREQSLRRIKAS